jgi:hypothetical protein
MGRRHPEAEVRVDVDFADGHGGGLPQHILRNADRVVHFAPFSLMIFTYSAERARAVQNDGEAGQRFCTSSRMSNLSWGFCPGLNL